jgi:uncharacterized protein YwqG
MTQDDLSALGVSELLDLWIKTKKEQGTARHLGRQNRLTGKLWKILDAVKSRDGTQSALQPLLAHPNLDLRLAAAIRYKDVDRDAFLAIVGDLAKRRDEIGSDARSSLDWDKTLREHRPVAPSPEVAARVAAWALRRVQHDPPAGLSRTEVEQRFRAEFSPDLATALLALARPAIGQWPQQISPEASPTASRFGGMPCVPKDWEWPRCDTEPLFFLAQVNCGELAGLPTATLPRRGLLAFFGDHDWVNGCETFSPVAAVYYWPEPSALSVADAPIDDFMVMPSCALRFFEAIDLPHPESNVITDLGLGQSQLDRYWDVWGALCEQAHGVGKGHDLDINKMFGWPNLIQEELETLDNQPEEGWRLLLQMGNYENGVESHSWGPGGNLYFMIREADLKQRIFDGCDFEMQCT